MQQWTCPQSQAFPSRSPSTCNASWKRLFPNGSGQHRFSSRSTGPALLPCKEGGWNSDFSTLNHGPRNAIRFHMQMPQVCIHECNLDLCASSLSLVQRPCPMHECWRQCFPFRDFRVDGWFTEPDVLKVKYWRGGRYTCRKPVGHGDRVGLNPGLPGERSNSKVSRVSNGPVACPFLARAKTTLVSTN